MTGEMVPGAGGLAGAAPVEPRGEIGGGKTVAGGRGVDHGTGHGLGGDFLERRGLDADEASGMRRVSGSPRRQGIR